MEAGDAEASGGALRSLAPHQLQGLLDSALRSSSVAASPHMDVLGEGALSIRWDQRSVMKLVQALDPARAHGAAAAAAPLQLGDAERVSWLHLMPDVKLAWPLNLVVSGRQLLQYQVRADGVMPLRVLRGWTAVRPLAPQLTRPSWPGRHPLLCCGACVV
jgi:hypothetical protein